MNTLHLFLTFALIHAPFALAQTVQEKFEQLVNFSNQEVPECKNEVRKASNTYNLESVISANYFIKNNFEKSKNILTNNFINMISTELLLNETHTNVAYFYDLQNLHQQKEALKSKILEKTKPKPSFYFLVSA